jgi:hypothetical protein
LFKNIAGKEIRPVDSLPKPANIPFQNRVPFIVHYIRKTSAISDPVHCSLHS